MPAASESQAIVARMALAKQRGALRTATGPAVPRMAQMPSAKLREFTRVAEHVAHPIRYHHRKGM